MPEYPVGPQVLGLAWLNTGVAESLFSDETPGLLHLSHLSHTTPPSAFSFFEEYLKLGTPGLADPRPYSRSTPSSRAGDGEWKILFPRKREWPQRKLVTYQHLGVYVKGFLCPTAKLIASEVPSLYAHTYRASSHPLGGSLLNMNGEP